jgi:hypothetical protein
MNVKNLNEILKNLNGNKAWDAPGPCKILRLMHAENPLHNSINEYNKHNQ